MRIDWKNKGFHLRKHVENNQMLRHSALLFAGYLTAHILNMLYQMVVSRALPKSEYALLAAFVGALLIVQYPLMTLTTALSHYSSLLLQHGRQGDVKRLLTRWLIRGCLAGAILIMAGLFFLQPITHMLHLDRSGPVIVAIFAVPAFLILPIVLGVSQGIQRFGWNAGTTMGGSFARILLGVLLITAFDATSGWALFGHGVGTAGTVIALAMGLYWVLQPCQSTQQPLPKLRFFLLQSGLAQLAYATLMTADVILVQHFLPQESDFAYAATLGRLTVFLSSTIVIAMFPKVTTNTKITPQQFLIFKQSLMYTTICAATAIIGCLLFPRLLLRILFGIKDPSQAQLYMTAAMACIMGVSAILNTCLQFLVAQKRFTPTLFVLLAAAGYLLAATIWHQYTWQILTWSAIANVLALLTLLPACRSAPRQTHEQ